MATLLSPGIQIVETDLSNVVSPVATSLAGYAGKAVWGPPMKRTLVTDENEFVKMFGEPTDTTYKDFFTVAGFLKYGNSLYFVRAIDETTANNASLTASLSGQNNTSWFDYISDWESYTPTFHGEAIKFFAKYPGVLGNTDIRVGLLTASDWSTQTGPASGYFDYVEYGPQTTTIANEKQYTVFVEVKNSSGDWELMEQHLVSNTKGVFDNSGNNIYVNDKINNSSKYILAFNNTGNTTGAISFAGTLLGGGTDGMPSSGNIMSAYDLFSNPEDIEVNYLIGGPNVSTTDGLPTYISGIAKARIDCFSIHDVNFNSSVGGTGILSPVQDDSTNVAEMIAYRNLTTINTSYSAIYGNWFYIYDKYNDVNRWVPSSGYVAGIYALTATRNDAWFAPAGLNRAILSGVIKLATNPKSAYRDKLYKAQINPIVNFQGQGIVIWGQKTSQTNSSAFDRVNVRLLFLYMEKAIGNSAKYVVFEQNDSLTRAVFMNMVKPFMEDIKGRRGVIDFLIDVSDKVNTPEVVDNNEFRANIFVKPTRSAEYIRINFIATKTGASFSELTV